jgi:signal transduction histidine kinase
MKHAPGAALNIRLELDDRAVTISVRNDTAATVSPIADTGSGLGLAGMRERIAARGGTLDAEHDGDRGFRLTATLPLNDTRRQILHPNAVNEPETLLEPTSGRTSDSKS